jgi:copper homeostasis protein
MTKSKKYRLELCCDSLQVALAAEGLVDQIEFCSDLINDGLTPDFDETLQLIQKTKTPIKVMIRNRKGDFEYNSEDLNIMYKQASSFKTIGINNFVFGATKKNRLDIGLIQSFATHVFPSKICVHKAIDSSDDILVDTEKLLSIANIKEILTSGGKETALEGYSTLLEMIAICGNKIDIIAAGKVTFQNIEEVHAKIQGKIYHGKRIISNII